MNFIEAKLEGRRLYRTDLEDGHYVVWSPLGLQEHLLLTEVALRSNPVGLFELEEKVLAKCIRFTSYSIEADDWERLGIETKDQASAVALELVPAGVLSTLRKVIIEKSAPPRSWGNLMSRAAQATKVLQPHEAAIAKVCSTFPAYKVSDLLAMESEEVIKLFALAMLTSGTPCEEEEAAKYSEPTAAAFSSLIEA